MALTAAPHPPRCSDCGSDDVQVYRAISGTDSAICRACGHRWSPQYTPAARRAAQVAAGGVSSAQATGNPAGPPDAPTGRLDALPDALTPKQVNDLVPGLDRDVLYQMLNEYDWWRTTQHPNEPGLPMPPADRWDTMLPCHRFGGTMGHDGLMRGGRFMVPKAVVQRWFFDLREGDAMGDGDGPGGG